MGSIQIKVTKGQSLPIYPNEMSLTELRLTINGWHPDLFGTFLSRKHSYHCMVGNRRWVKPKKEVMRLID